MTRREVLIDGAVLQPRFSTVPENENIPLGITGRELPVGFEFGYQFPLVNNERIALGSVVGFDAATKVTTLVFLRADNNFAAQTIFSRWNDTALPGDVSDQWLHAISGGFFTWGTWGAGARAFGQSPTALTAGQRIKSAFVFDGTLAGNANRLKHFLSTYLGGHLFSASTQEVLVFSGAAVPAALPTAAAINAMIGNTVAGTNSPCGSIVTQVRVWLGTALTQAQLDAETELSSVVAPSLWYKLDGNAVNSGSLAGFNGVISSLIKSATLMG